MDNRSICFRQTAVFKHSKAGMLKMLIQMRVDNITIFLFKHTHS